MTRLVHTNIREALQAALPQLRMAGLRELSTAWGTHVYETDDGWILRWARKEDPGALAREARLLKLLRGRSSLAIPAVEIATQLQGRELVAYRKLAGEPLSSGSLERLGSPQRVGQQLGRFLAELHDATDVLDDQGDGSQQWLTHLDEGMQALRDVVMPTLEPSLRRDLEQLLRVGSSDRRQRTFVPALVHGDLTGENILHDAEGACLTGVIDFTSAAIGDAAWDFAHLIDFFDPTFAQSVARHYDRSDPGLWERAALLAGAVPYLDLLNATANDEPSYVESVLLRLRLRRR